MNEVNSRFHLTHPNPAQAASSEQSGQMVDDVFYSKNPDQKYCLPNQAPINRLLVFWLYDGQRRAFLLDKTGAYLFNHHDYHDWFTGRRLASFLDKSASERLRQNLINEAMGDVIFEHITLTKGPYANHTFMVQGTIQARDENGAAIYACGYISHENSPFSELISRELSADGMFLWNAETDEVITSASYHEMLGYTAAEFPKTFREFVAKVVYPDDNDIMLVQSRVSQCTDYGDEFECCIRLKHKNGKPIWTIGRGTVLTRNAEGVATQIMGSQTNIDIVKSNFDNIKFLLFTDSLTGLHNRVYLNQNAVRYEDPACLPLSIIFIDVSGLKLTNDILGHNYGDYLLTKTCELIKVAIASISDISISEVDPRNNEFAELTAYLQQKHRGDPESEIQSLANSGMMDDVLSERYKVRTNGSNRDSGTIRIQSNKQKITLEIMRLAGDEFLLVYPNSTTEDCQTLVDKIELLRQELNAYHAQHTRLEDRPVPIFFGIGHATTTGEEQKDILQHLIDRADENMQLNKESHRQRDYAELKAFFELKKGRPVSMRDDRRFTVLTQKEREEIRRIRTSSLIS